MFGLGERLAVVTGGVTSCSANAAVTLLAPSMVTTQLPVPEQSPLQPIKTEPAVAVGVRVTPVPLESNGGKKVGTSSTI